MEAFLCFLFALILGLVWIGGAFAAQYNQLQSLRHRIEQAQANIGVILQKRADLAHQLAAIAYEYAHLEVPAMVSIARNVADVDSMESAAQQISAALNSVILVSQQYPQLRSIENFERMAQEARELEDELQARREEYNSLVNRYNTLRDRFPTVLLANHLGFKPLPYWQSKEPEGSLDVVGRYSAPGLPGMPSPGTQARVAFPPATPKRVLPPSKGSAPHAWLQVVRGPAESKIVTVYDGLIIGRTRNADVRLTGPHVSRQHAVIRMHGGRFYLQDQGSANGTYVNGRRITATELKDGDRIQIGDVELVFRMKSNPIRSLR